MDSTKIIHGNDFLDILFDGRNKDYGAYELRSRYDSRVRNAIIGTASLMLVLVGGYMLDNALHAAVRTDKPVFKITDITPIEPVLPKEEKPVIPPPPVTSAPPPAAATVKVTTPRIEPDDQVREADEMLAQNEIKPNVAIGVANTAGADDGVPPEMLAGKGSGVVAAPPGKTESETPLTFVEIMPEFPGGEAAMMKFLSKNIRYPHAATENGIEGTVFIQFVVNRDGTITDVKTTGAAKGGGLEEEAIRVVKTMPKWKPGRQNNQSVAVYFNLPVRFKLDHE
ncbi:energy transducer TonB [Chitinophaga vietnamensis]|uniref:energy transducer TonB n=1 Tax=Chitinophaga vietnamensis TaxID=2593957 RepID=UPI001375FB53|nr:energy transducer TonB [Chitinophaga vietnamensis]